MCTILCVDWGSKRIGIAIGNTQEKIAAPLKIIPRKPWQKALDELQMICKTRKVGKIIMGWPSKNEGSSRRWGMIKSAIGLFKDSDLPEVVLQDEYGTSCAAETILIGSEIKHCDSYAAAIILQDYLDRV